MRSNKIYLMTPSELAIYNAMQEVEKLGANIKLTEAIVKLQEAQKLVSDFVDGEILK